MRVSKVSRVPGCKAPAKRRARSRSVQLQNSCSSIVLVAVAVAAAAVAVVVAVAVVAAVGRKYGAGVIKGWDYGARGPGPGNESDLSGGFRRFGPSAAEFLVVTGARLPSLN